MADTHLSGAERSTRPARRWRTRLEGAFYGFRLVWNSRAHRWLLDITDAAGGSVARGLGVAVDLDLLAAVSVSNRPPGQLFVRDDSGAGRIPTRQGWSEGFRLLYRPEADVAIAAGTSDEVR